MKKLEKKKGIGIFIFIVNLFLIVLLILVFCLYYIYNQNNIQQQNLLNIENLNQSSSELSAKFFENQQKELCNAAQYIIRNKFNLTQVLNYLYDSNADYLNTYEVIGQDYTGYLAKKNEIGQYYPVNYASRDYKDLHKILDKANEKQCSVVGFAPEFTDLYNAVKSFGVYTTIPVLQANGKTEYFVLFSILKSKEFSAMIQLGGGYTEIASVIFDSQGNYILSNDSFKSDNLFQYFYLYNNLTLDEKNALSNQVLSSQKGKLFYKNGINKDSVFIYSKMEMGDWYIVTTVPLDEFQQNHLDYRFTIVLVMIMFALFIVDILWMNNMNRRLKVSMKQEKKANNAKSDFLARMSHDIRTPLNAIIGFSNLAKEEESLPKAAIDSLEKINSSGKYLLGLINDILDMSKIESNKFELHETLVHEPELLEEIAQVFIAQAAQKGITLSTDFSKVKAPWIYMDELRSRQIYNNLLNNAIKFSERNTTITWKVIDTLLDEREIRQVAVISDEGCGMSKEFMEHIFSPFEQERNMHSDQEGGTGLGLSIVKSLVELMQGTIEVESELGKGTTFTITLNRQIGKKPKDLNQGNSIKEESILKGKRVLLCEDHPLNREIAVRLLKKKEMFVECAVNGEEGVRQFKESEEGFYDVILMDIRMPVMNGLEAAQAIRLLDHCDAKKIPIIAMTANAFEDDIDSCIQAGMNAHIAKPVEPKVLYETLTKYL